MLRLLFRLIVLAFVLAGVAVCYAAYRWGNVDLIGRGAGSEAGAVAGGGAAGDAIDRERVREAGAEIAETLAQNADRAEALLEEAGLTAKITSKMALDDTIEARRLDVDTDGTVVTVRGSVDTQAQRARALQLARETNGVTQVVDRIEVREK